MDGVSNNTMLVARTDGLLTLASDRVAVVVRVASNETINEVVLEGIKNLLPLVVDLPPASRDELLRRFPYLAVVDPLRREEHVAPLEASECDDRVE